MEVDGNLEHDFERSLFVQKVFDTGFRNKLEGAAPTGTKAAGSARDRPTYRTAHKRPQLVIADLESVFILTAKAEASNTCSASSGREVDGRHNVDAEILVVFKVLARRKSAKKDPVKGLEF